MGTEAARSLSVQRNTLILLVFENGKSINIQKLLKIKFEIIISIHLIKYLLDLCPQHCYNPDDAKAALGSF